MRQKRDRESNLMTAIGGAAIDRPRCVGEAYQSEAVSHFGKERGITRSIWIRQRYPIAWFGFLSFPSPHISIVYDCFSNVYN
ncbi:MAG: hypothetical protein KME18_26585 [Phormidium tanganyikae FI6-MK23]|nr:hypothetical protein [Phormidium tanganyikae FI6-MK23]